MTHAHTLHLANTAETTCFMGERAAALSPRYKKSIEQKTKKKGIALTEVKLSL